MPGQVVFAAETWKLFHVFSAIPLLRENIDATAGLPPL